MAIDPRKLTPTQLARLLNSTPLGEVISERQIHRHRTRGGYRIGEGRYIDLLKYTAWLAQQRHYPKPTKPPMDYGKIKEAARARASAISEAGRDIGEIPPVADPERKERATRDFRFFCEAYFPETFHLEWSPDHLKVITKIERAVLDGGLFAMAMPRATGKTVLCERACLWAILYGHRQFVCLIGSDESSAVDMLDAIKSEIEDNELLLADFPEAVYPIARLEGKTMDLLDVDF